NDRRRQISLYGWERRSLDGNVVRNCVAGDSAVRPSMFCVSGLNPQENFITFSTKNRAVRDIAP
ncbi:MAG TPA: hypothetical protein PLO50_13610, partial [Nitrospira sp.]|nr:hypothetical protein [Nitrospira sp.]